MDTSEPIVTIKLTTDNSQTIGYLVQLVIVTLIILNVKLIMSIITDFVKFALKRTEQPFYIREDPRRNYTQLENPSDM
jgi:hypothetical protein